MATVGSEGARGTRESRGYGEIAHASVAASRVAPLATQRSKSFTRPIFVLTLGVFYLILVLGLSGCLTGSPDDKPAAEEVPGVSPPAAPRPQEDEIPGVVPDGAPEQEIPGVERAGAPDHEIPGVSSAPSLEPSTSPAASALLAQAVVEETAKIEAELPPGAQARLKFLHSLPPAFSSEEVSLLETYDWVSPSAAKKFDEALALIAEG